MLIGLHCSFIRENRNQIKDAAKLPRPDEGAIGAGLNQESPGVFGPGVCQQPDASRPKAAVRMDSVLESHAMR